LPGFLFAFGQRLASLSGGGKRSLLGSGRQRIELGSPTAGAALEHVPVMQEAVEHGADRRRIAQQLAPILDRAI
jgi:hypothetical protein